MFDNTNLSEDVGLSLTQPDSFESSEVSDEVDFGSMAFGEEEQREQVAEPDDIWGSSFQNSLSSSSMLEVSDESVKSEEGLREERMRKYKEKLRKRAEELRNAEASSKEPVVEDTSIESNTPTNEPAFGDTSVNWGETSGVEQDLPASDEGSNYIMPSSDESWGTSGQSDESGYVTEIKETPYKKDVNLSKKAVSLIVAGAFVVLALLFTGLDKWTNRPDSDKSKPTKTPSTVTSAPSDTTATLAPNVQSSNVGANAFVLIPIPDDMSLNYSGNIYETSGVVVAREKFVQGKQVLYCITIRVSVGSSAVDVKYYCNYASFSAVRKGDLLQIMYQQVDDSYISVNEIRK